MQIETPPKYTNYNPELVAKKVEAQMDAHKSFQNVIHDILEFKKRHPDSTQRELTIYTRGIMLGRTPRRKRK
jgi:hypothetical protein